MATVTNETEQKQDKPETQGKKQRRTVPALLVEATPERGGLGHWLLASPVIVFIGWYWVDVFAYLSPIPWRWLDIIIGALLYVSLFILPLGYGAHWLVTRLPGLFQHAGWDVQPLEPVSPAEAYLVRYVYQAKHREKTDWKRVWLRAGQGWVYLEIAIIFAAAVGMVPLFFSAVDFGFGR
jgi:hypothetical protein